MSKRQQKFYYNCATYVLSLTVDGAAMLLADIRRREGDTVADAIVAQFSKILAEVSL